MMPAAWIMRFTPTIDRQKQLKSIELVAVESLVADLAKDGRPA